MVVMAESVHDQVVDVMAVGDAEAAEAVGSRRKKRAQTELRGDHVASKEEYAGTVSPAEEADGKLGGARRAVKKEKKAAVKKKKVTCAGTVSTAEEAAGKPGGAGMAVLKKMAARRPDARTEFRGVSRTAKGKYSAHIWDSKVKSARSLGTFGTAVEAARAYDAAAVEMRGASAVTNFKSSGELSGEAVGSVNMKEKKPPAAKQAVRTEFFGVHRLPNGKYRARIWKGRTAVSLGRFGTAEEAARAYDAAAVKLRGAAARTNFEQQPTPATSNFEQKPTPFAADEGEVSSMDLPNDYPELPPLDFPESLIPGPQMDDLRTDLPPADWQLVHDFLKDFDQVVA